MRTENINLKRLITGEVSEGWIRCKIRNTDSNGVSKTEKSSCVFSFRYNKITGSDKYLARWQLGSSGSSGVLCSIKVTPDEDLDFIEDSENPLISYKLFIRR